MDDKKKLLNLDNDSLLISDEDDDLIKPKAVTTSQYEREPEAPTTSQSQPVFENGTFDNSEDVPPLLTNADEHHSTLTTNVSYRIEYIVFIIIFYCVGGSDSY